MNTITKTLHLTAFVWAHGPPGDVHWAITESKYQPGEHGAVGCWPHPVTLPIPEDFFNPVAVEVGALEAQKLKALADYQRTVAEINTRLSKLQAITNEVAA